MALTEEAFAALVDAGCDCQQIKRLVVDALVPQKLTLLGGEPYGPPAWGYKGEELVRGTYRIACDGCKRELFTATACPRCEAADGVARALESENAFPLPAACGACGSEHLTATAFVSARVIYEGKRAAKARSTTSPYDPGFHAIRVECKTCHESEQRRSPCPLCGV
jgi:hypothetical protein